MSNESAVQEEAAAEAGGQVRREVAMTLATFEAIDLDGLERLSAVASVVAASAIKRHAAAPDQFLTHLLELTRPGVPADEIVLPPSRGEPNAACVAEGLAVLDGGLDAIARILARNGAGGRQLNLVESVMLARLLGPHRAPAIRRALATVGRMIAAPGFQAGDVVIVPEIDEPARAAA